MNVVELTFNEVGSKYVAEFSVDGDFNLHIEKPRGGEVFISKSTVFDEGATFVRELKMGDYQGVLDKDFSEVITPKAYRITSSTQYVKAVVTAYEEIIEKKGTQTLLVYRNNHEEGAFTIEYKEGMTWEEWCNSDLNNTELVAGDRYIHYGEGMPELLFDGNFSGDYPVPGTDTINKSDVISPDMKYITWWYD